MGPERPRGRPHQGRVGGQHGPIGGLGRARAQRSPLVLTSFFTTDNPSSPNEALAKKENFFVVVKIRSQIRLWNWSFLLLVRSLSTGWRQLWQLVIVFVSYVLCVFGFSFFCVFVCCVVCCVWVGLGVVFCVVLCLRVACVAWCATPCVCVACAWVGAHFNDSMGPRGSKSRGARTLGQCRLYFRSSPLRQIPNRVPTSVTKAKYLKNKQTMSKTY